MAEIIYFDQYCLKANKQKKYKRCVNRAKVNYREKPLKDPLTKTFYVKNKKKDNFSDTL